MTTTYTFPPPAPDRDTAHALPPTRYHPSAAFWIGIGALCFTGGLDIAVLMLMSALDKPWKWAYLGWMMGVSACVFLITWGVFLVWWQVKMVNQPVKEVEREYKRKVAELELKVQQLLSGEKVINMVDVEKGQALELYGWRLLFYELIERPKTAEHVTREYAEKYLGIPQRAYRKLNAVLVDAGIKTENAWPDYDDLLPLYDYGRIQWRPEGEGAWINGHQLRFPPEWSK